MSDNRGLDFLKGFLVGGALGAIIALLYAPKSGRETREDLGGKMGDIYEKAKDEYDVSLERARRSYENAIAKLKDLEIDAKNKATEVEGLMNDLVAKGKVTVEGSTGRLKEALHAAKNAFKDESDEKTEDA